MKFSCNGPEIMSLEGQTRVWCIGPHGQPISWEQPISDLADAALAGSPIHERSAEFIFVAARNGEGLFSVFAKGGQGPVLERWEDGEPWRLKNLDARSVLAQFLIRFAPPTLETGFPHIVWYYHRGRQESVFDMIDMFIARTIDPTTKGYGLTAECEFYSLELDAFGRPFWNPTVFHDMDSLLPAVDAVESIFRGTDDCAKNKVTIHPIQNPTKPLQVPDFDFSMSCGLCGQPQCCGYCGG